MILIIVSVFGFLLLAGIILLFIRINETKSLIRSGELTKTIQTQNEALKQDSYARHDLQTNSQPALTTSPNKLSFPSISTKTGEESHLDFVRTKVNTLPSNLIPISMSREQASNLSSTMSSIAGVGIGVGAQALAVKGLYRATASATQLMRYADGTVSSMIKQGGQFAKHAGFTSAGLSAVAPMAIFQVAAAVTGQYYMNIITKQLKKLDESVQTILQKIESNNRGELRTIQSNIAALAHQNQYTPDDLVMIRQYMHKTLVLYYNYVDQIKGKTTEEEIKRIIVTNSATHAKDIRLTKENLEQKDLQYLCDIAETAFKTFSLLEIIYFKMLCLSGQSDPAYLAKVDSIILSFKTNQFEDTEYIKGICKLQSKVKDRIKKAQKEAASYNDKIDKHNVDINQYFQRLLDRSDEQLKELKLTRQSIVQKFDQKQELYYDATDPNNIKVYYKELTD